MTFKHYDVVRAASPSDLAEQLTQKIKEGWQPFGSPVAITPYTLMQAIAAEGDVSTAVVSPGDDNAWGVTAEPEFYYVLSLAGQSNGMAYGEGLPLPDSFDRPEPRIKQLARRSTVTPGGEACSYNDVILADHCLHDVQDMSSFNHPKADLSKGQYGCVGQGCILPKNGCLTFRRMPGYFWFPAVVVVRHSPPGMKAHSVRPAVLSPILYAGGPVSPCIRTW